jgi:hypothetical protein
LAALFSRVPSQRRQGDHCATCNSGSTLTSGTFDTSARLRAFDQMEEKLI